jgi:hypothetical protein
MINQRKVSTHTLASHRDTCRLLLKFAAVRGSKPPACLQLADLAAPTVMEFWTALKLSDTVPSAIATRALIYCVLLSDQSVELQHIEVVEEDMTGVAPGE